MLSVRIKFFYFPTVGIQYTPPTTDNEENEMSENSRRRRTTDQEEEKIDTDFVDKEYCVVIKPPPPTPEPTRGPGIFKTVEPVYGEDSVNYTMAITNSKCLFWKIESQSWESTGCFVRTNNLTLSLSRTSYLVLSRKCHFLKNLSVAAVF